MSGKTTPWEQIIAIAKRIESRVGARRPIEPQMGLDLVRAVLSFDTLMSQWRTHLSGAPDVPDGHPPIAPTTPPDPE
jgi:hypothetical protein